MSEATKVIALQEAVKTRNAGGVYDPDAILLAAAKFDAFISGTAAPASEKTPPPAKVEKAAAPAKAEKAAAPAKAKAAAEDVAAAAIANAADEGDEPGDPVVAPITKEAIAEAITGLIQAGARDRAVALLNKYGAASVGKLAAKDYASVMSEIEVISEEVALAS